MNNFKVGDYVLVTNFEDIRELCIPYYTNCACKILDISMNKVNIQRGINRKRNGDAWVHKNHVIPFLDQNKYYMVDDE